MENELTAYVRRPSVPLQPLVAIRNEPFILSAADWSDGMSAGCSVGGPTVRWLLRPCGVIS